MKVRVTLIASLVVVCAALCLSGCARVHKDAYKTVSIKEIQDEPMTWVDRSVRIVGHVDSIEEVDPTRPTHAYILQDKHGYAIRVTSDSHPVFKDMYEVFGKVKIGEYVSRAELVETWREPARNITTLVTVAAVVAFAVLVIALAWLLSRLGRKPKPAGTDGPTTTASTPATDVPIAAHATVILPPQAPADVTLEYIPGKLVFVSGPDAGKAIALMGRREQGGSVMTIGRRPESGRSRYCHLRVQDTPELQTVGRSQAEIWYSAGRVLVKDVASVNHTEVNGVPLGSGEARELRPGDRLKMGALEFQYNA